MVINNIRNNIKCIFTAVQKLPFDSNNLKRPVVNYDKEEAGDKVTLICKIEMENKNISTWTNVTYEIQWFANGVAVGKKELRCEPTDVAKSESDFPCPGRNGFRGDNEIGLSQDKYALGDFVSGFAFSNLFPL